MSSQQPLLSSNPWTEDDADADSQDGEGLASSLSPSAGGPTTALGRLASLRKMVISAAVVVLGLTIWSTAFAIKRWKEEVPRTNVILMVSDGFGPASEAFARDFYKHLNGLSWRDNYRLPLDEILVGSSRTRSSNSHVTDSAAGATAFSCAQKSYNGAISVEAVDRDMSGEDDVMWTFGSTGEEAVVPPPGKHHPCGTVMEAAKADGYHTGLVVTSRLTHATPACFYAHVVDRDMESEIAEFLVGDGPLGHVVDLALGGGSCFFRPNNTDSLSCRTDSKNLIASAEKKGTRVLLGPQGRNGSSEFSACIRENGTLPLPLIGLFHPDHMNYEIDRLRLPDEKAEPSLQEMTAVALRTLDAAAKAKGGNKGFVLLVEGSRIDMAAHSNDPANHARDILQYQETVAFVKSWIDGQSASQRSKTIMISVSDHETGGLALARQLDPKIYPTYEWYPAALANATHSSIYLGLSVARRAAESGDNKIPEEWLREEILGQGLGIWDASEHEVKKIWKKKKDSEGLNRLLADMSSRRAQVGWSTSGHSAVDVNLYLHPSSMYPDFRGSKENTEVGELIVQHLGVNLEAVTIKLSENVDSWFHWETTSRKEKGGQQKRDSCGGHERGIQHFHH